MPGELIAGIILCCIILPGALYRISKWVDERDARGPRP